MQSPEVLTYYSAVGSFTGGQVNQGFIFITMKPVKERTLLNGHHETQAEFMQIARKQFGGIVGVDRAMVWFQDMD